MNSEAKKLYESLPAVYRVRDAGQGEPLKALCEVIAEQIAVLRENLEQLYDDQFIETCAEWAAPYIGDLIGYRTLHGVTARTRSARAEVANTIAYRRRKGTATVLEQLARDVTGWNARVVEFFQSLAASQYVNHIRPECAATVDLRDWEALERRGTAFNTLAHSVDVRRIENQKGRYNIPNLGLFLWRLDGYSIRRSPAFRLDDERYLFSPLGHDLQLFTRPATETDISHLAEPVNVPEPISRRVLQAYLDRYYGPQASLYAECGNIDTSSGNVRVCNLSDSGGSWAHLPVNKVSIDPVLGRIAFPPGNPPQNLRVTFHYGFSRAMGGGEYERGKTFALGGAPVAVTQGQDLQAAINAAAGGGSIEIRDSGRYPLTGSIAVNGAAKLELRAANEHRPLIALGGDLAIDLHPGSELTLNGLLISGGRLRIRAVAGSGPRLLRLRHCTLVPGLSLTGTGDPAQPNQASLVIEQEDAAVDIDSCILGALRTVRGVAVKLKDCIVDATAASLPAFAALDGVSAGGALSAVNSTVIGKVHTARVDLASNVVFAAALAAGDGWTHAVRSDENQKGCVRFSYLPVDAVVPRRYRCQPDLAVAQALSAADFPKGSLSDVKRLAITAAVQARIRPAFTTLRYGQPGYCQLGTFCPAEIRAGAEDEAEMGAFHDVFTQQREGNLKIRLREYLRFGLEAGIFYAT